MFSHTHTHIQVHIRSLNFTISHVYLLIVHNKEKQLYLKKKMHLLWIFFLPIISCFIAGFIRDLLPGFFHKPRASHVNNNWARVYFMRIILQCVHDYKLIPRRDVFTTPSIIISFVVSEFYRSLCANYYKKSVFSFASLVMKKNFSITHVTRNN